MRKFFHISDIVAFITGKAVDFVGQKTDSNGSSLLTQKPQSQKQEGKVMANLIDQ